MKKMSATLFSFCFSLIFAAIPVMVSAHGGGHSHAHDKKAVTKEVAKKNAKKELMRLVKEKKIDGSWKSGVFVNMVKKTFGHDEEWVASYSNEKGKKGKQIFIFLKLSGAYIAANFSGK